MTDPNGVAPLRPAAATGADASPTATAATSKPSSSSSSSNKHRTWDENYAELLTYKAMHGHCDVPYGYKVDPVLGKWVSHLRENQAQPLMSAERKAALNAIGFTWNPLEKRWNDMFAKLQAYHAKFGTTKVPSHYKEDRTLGKWVKRQRENHNSGILQDHRREQLDALNFVWKLSEREKPPRKSKANEDQWSKQYQALVDYKQEFGNVNVPKTYGSLGKWVSKQRLQNNRNLLCKKRRTLLEDVGFVFSFQAQKKQQEWNRMYELLKACQLPNSNAEFQVPKTGPDAGSVARWVQRQREKYRQGKLDPGRQVLLRKLNFTFPAEGDGGDQSVDSGHTSEGDSSSNTNGTHPLHLRLQEEQLHQEVVSGVVDAMHAEDDQAAVAAGMEIAHCIDVLAKYMSTTPTELAARLPLPSKKRTVNAMMEASSTSTTTSPTTTIPRPRISAFGRIMPLIVALRDAAAKWGGTAKLKDAAVYLEQVLKQEKGIVVEPHDSSSKEGSYHELLSLAVEMGELLDSMPAKRCDPIAQSCEAYLQHLTREITGEKAQEVVSSNSSTAAADDESISVDVEGAGRTKRVKRSV